MQNTNGMNNVDNANKLQSAISDDLFPQVQHISDVKQVIEEMTTKSQALREPQVKAILYLKRLGENKYLYPDKNPYKEITDYITKQGKTDVADPDYYLDTIEALIPKPPKPIVMAPGDAKGGKK
ncbi:hypothetical protein SAMN05421839_12543 [Halolactibacillus halophilus]|uniref:Uncharacterized protein n=1 Tax=Halolactibacillus halophilus TaxID=306540 RepID=A0A1I5QYQ6_9BACI|nr:hypothetical protein HHA03_15270 [Halolactibacillus halophilus]SFP51181.1 hypothetical protein SAMN05421839_12543 [Halolactibacillus halophilus]